MNTIITLIACRHRFARCKCRYDFSPIMVRMVETRDSFLTFLVSVCAILGGVFTLAGLLDQVAYRTTEGRKGK